MKPVSSLKTYMKRDSLAKHPKGRAVVTTKTAKTDKSSYGCKIVDLGDGYFKRVVAKKAKGK